MYYNLSYYLIGDHKPFLVKVETTDMVGNLLNEIINAQPTLANIAPSSLRLYRADIDDSLDHTGRIRELKRLTQNLDGYTVMDDMLEPLSDIFTQRSRGTFTIVQMPLAGESVVWCRR
jgi:hypothetical protein